MFMSQKDKDFFCVNADCLSTSTLLALDEYWTNNRSHPIHQQIHEIIETLITQRGEKPLKQKRLLKLMILERCFAVSNPMGRFSANIISHVTKFMIKKNY